MCREKIFSRRIYFNVLIVIRLFTSIKPMKKLVTTIFHECAVLTEMYVPIAGFTRPHATNGSGSAVYPI